MRILPGLKLAIKSMRKGEKALIKIRPKYACIYNII